MSNKHTSQPSQENSTATDSLQPVKQAPEHILKFQRELNPTPKYKIPTPPPTKTKK